jgi:hypothetical protein
VSRIHSNQALVLITNFPPQMNQFFTERLDMIITYTFDRGTWSNIRLVQYIDVHRSSFLKVLIASDSYQSP